MQKWNLVLNFTEFDWYDNRVLLKLQFLNIFVLFCYYSTPTRQVPAGFEIYKKQLSFLQYILSRERAARFLDLFETPSRESSTWRLGMCVQKASAAVKI